MIDLQQGAQVRYELCLSRTFGAQAVIDRRRRDPARQGSGGKQQERAAIRPAAYGEA